ncbi:CarD family transcriptional regulator [Lentibacillus amyloliquefaciens]|uniref:CarD family transcriptional regulator n=1 Tax=Lentibacillus amyloliquefaciens TaxID=1472767 RepID=A0A0U4EEF2_9BACI|nr:CarD family transcriptional regulator [Lentibacillus amyloliquefaciens]ALX48921.1 CarD family transcriptional regulator [Lentibacillus amyloliquefaciens]
MHDIGDLIIYSGHGICRVDDISDKNLNGSVKKYYVLRPIEDNHQLTINTPADNSKIKIQNLIRKSEAEIILTSFQSNGIDWIDNSHSRIRQYKNTVDTGNRVEIAKIANTLMRKKDALEAEGKKFFEQDNKLLASIQNILFKELSIVLDTTIEDIHEKVNQNLYHTV